MAKDQTKSAKCVRDLRDAPLEEFKLPDDKRQWKPVARDRQALANFLATYADGDGSRIFPSIETMTDHFGWGRATTFRRLADLRSLNLLSEKTGLHGKQGTAVRKMDVFGFRKQTFTGSAAIVKNAFVGVSKSGDKESQSQDQGVSKSLQGVSPMRETQPPRFTATETATATATNSQAEQQGWLSLQKKHLADIGYFGRKRADFQKFIDEFGFDVVDKATVAAIAEGNLESAKSKAGCIVFRLGEKIAAEVKKRDAAAQSANDEAIIIENCDQQMRASVIQRDVSQDALKFFDKTERRIMEGFVPRPDQGFKRREYEHYCSLTRAEQRLAYHLAETWRERIPVDTDDDLFGKD